jgi:hypothetical protein
MKSLLLVILFISIQSISAEEDDYDLSDFVIDFALGAGVDICEQYYICEYIMSIIAFCTILCALMCICTKNVSLEDISLKNIGKGTFAMTGGYYASKSSRRAWR